MKEIYTSPVVELRCFAPVETLASAIDFDNMHVSPAEKVSAEGYQNGDISVAFDFFNF